LHDSYGRYFKLFTAAAILVHTLLLVFFVAPRGVGFETGIEELEVIDVPPEVKIEAPITMVRVRTRIPVVSVPLAATGGGRALAAGCVPLYRTAARRRLAAPVRLTRRSAADYNGVALPQPQR
jgi:hypothetical protein